MEVTVESQLKLQDLPTSVLQIIVRFLPAGELIFHVACTCRNAAEAIRTLDECSLWESLHKSRWQIPSVSFTKDEYRRRHFIQAGVIGTSFSNLKETTEVHHCEASSSLTSPAAAAIMTESMSCVEEFQELEDNIYVLQHPAYALEVFWRANKHSPHSKMLLALSTLQRFYSLLQEEEEMTILFEKCLVLLSNLFLKEEDQYQCLLIVDLMQSESIKFLDSIAAEIKQRLSSANDDDDDDTASIDCVNQVLFRDYGFKGNAADYYNYRNSLLHDCLEQKMGIPMTLALIYKSVCRRLGIQVDIIGLPGHIVVYVPSIQTYLDVFRQGQLMTEHDCEIIVNSFGYKFRDAFLEPLDLDDILMRIFKNSVSALGLRPEIERELRIVQCLAYILAHRNIMSWDEMSEYVCSRLYA